MKNLKKILTVTLFSSFMVSSLFSSCFAANSSVKSDRENECGIYLCLPSGFGEGCSSVYSSFISRITDLDFDGNPNYTSLPAFSNCVDSSDSVLASQYGSGANVDALERYDSHIPEHKECTAFHTWNECKKCSDGGNGGGDYYCDCVEKRKCTEWKVVPEHYIENTPCLFSNISGFKLDDIGQIIGTNAKPEWCDATVHVLGVTVDGSIVGNEWREFVGKLINFMEMQNY